MNLSNKNILITGASSGIGYQLSKDLANEGANLALLARRKNILDDLAEELKKRKDGCIVGISSLSDSRGFPRSAAYCSSKAAASIFLESIRIELKKYNVKVITVKPGFVKTPMTDKNKFHMPFLMNVEKASKIILNGIKKEKNIIQFPLPTVWGAKLLKILPDSLFNYFSNLPLPPKK